MKKRVCLVAGSSTTRNELERQLEEYLGGAAELDCHSVGEGLPARLTGDLIILSSDLVEAELRDGGLLTGTENIFVARRTVNCDHLDLVVGLAPGTRALFVNDREETALACIEALAELGLDGVEYSPYYPGLPPPPEDIKVAVTAGELALVPPGMTTVIDIGPRILDFGSIAEILVRLDLPERTAGGFARRYLSAIVSVARRLARSTEESRRLNAHLSGVIDSLSHGILVYDAEGRVSVCNENLRGLLGLRPADAQSGRSLASIIRSRSLLDFLEAASPGGSEAEESAIFRLAEGDVIVHRFEAAGGNRIATFRDERDAAAEGARLAREYRRRGYVAKYTMGDIVGASEAIRRAKKVAERLAATDLTILIHGESGTGKELFASAIHDASGRRSGPFLAVDLGALSDDLIESELFGYEEGAFTGAKKGGKAGLFELADGGTIFLDEIGHISPKVQTRLLRVLQEKEVLRVGGSEIKRIDVRVIAASNEDLLERARRGKFREDLYFRLKTGLLRIPPLRERATDIPLLIRAFIKSEGKGGVEVDPAVLVTFGDYAWPGNVRELRNLITYMLAVSEGPSITLGDLPDEGFFEAFSRPANRGAAGDSAAGPGTEGGDVEGRAGPGPGSAPALPTDPFGAARAVEGGLGLLDRCVLAAIAALEAEGRATGREAVARYCAERGRALGPGAVRARFERLAALGLVTTARGPRGTSLTDEGRRKLASA
jgi:transcriptional regulator with PAS, ATPase and Fis domain